MVCLHGAWSSVQLTDFQWASSLYGQSVILSDQGMHLVRQSGCRFSIQIVLRMLQSSLQVLSCAEVEFFVHCNFGIHSCVGFFWLSSFIPQFPTCLSDSLMCCQLYWGLKTHLSLVFFQTRLESLKCLLWQACSALCEFLDDISHYSSWHLKMPW